MGLFQRPLQTDRCAIKQVIIRCLNTAVAYRGRVGLFWGLGPAAGPRCPGGPSTNSLIDGELVVDPTREELHSCGAGALVFLTPTTSKCRGWGGQHAGKFIVFPYLPHHIWNGPGPLSRWPWSWLSQCWGSELGTTPLRFHTQGRWTSLRESFFQAHPTLHTGSSYMYSQQTLRPRHLEGNYTAWHWPRWAN